MLKYFVFTGLFFGFGVLQVCASDAPLLPDILDVKTDTNKQPKKRVNNPYLWQPKTSSDATVQPDLTVLQAAMLIAPPGNQ